jgi:hypothetical protein
MLLADCLPADCTWLLTLGSTKCSAWLVHVVHLDGSIYAEPKKAWIFTELTEVGMTTL